MLDATGSMRNLLTASKDTIELMFKEARDVLKENNLDEDLFSVQIMVYRNYNATKEGLKIYQDSGPQTDPVQLKNFLKDIKHGAGYNDSVAEAIEIPFYYLNQQISNNVGTKPKTVLLIGDAPANSSRQSKIRRLDDSSAPITTFNDELNAFRKHNIPVNTFYLASDARDQFVSIAQSTGGKPAPLNVNESAAAATALKVAVTEQILNSIGGSDLVQKYREKRAKSYVSPSSNSGATMLTSPEATRLTAPPNTTTTTTLPVIPTVSSTVVAQTK